MYVSYHKVETEISALLHKVLEGEEIIILRHNKPVAKISPLKETSKKRKIGSAKGLIHTSEDFDAPLDEMKDYMY